MGNYKRAAAVIMTATLACFVPAEGNAEAKQINKKSAVLYVGKTTALRVKGVRKIKWRSSKKQIAAVSSKGIVTAKKAGKTWIIATIGKKSYRCRVTVKNPYLDATDITLVAGRSRKLVLTGASIRSCRSDNTAAATVTDRGVVRGIRPGTARISVRASNKRTYSCRVRVKSVSGFHGNDNAAGNTSTPSAQGTPSESMAPLQGVSPERCAHDWQLESEKYAPFVATWEKERYHNKISTFQCSKCGCVKKEYSEKEACSITVEEKTKATCTEDGEGISRCSVCGYESALHPISKKGHDFSYEYHKQIKIWGNWETNYDYITEHAWESRGERTATCKTCGERFEEIGFNTGVEQKDGTRAEVWGVEERPAAAILFGEINNYRASTYSSQGSYLKTLERSKALDQYALFRAAQAAARCLKSDAVGVVAVDEWLNNSPGATIACGAVCAGQGSKIDLYSFVQGTYRLLIESLKYAGCAHFRCETENGLFADSAAVVGDWEDRVRIDCDKIGHDSDYADVCHRCGARAEYALKNDRSPYYYDDEYEGEGGTWVHAAVGSGTSECWDSDHDNICDGCLKRMIELAAWNTCCNLARFGYDGMEFDKFKAGNAGAAGWFEQSHWREKCQSYVDNGALIRSKKKD